MPPTEGEPTKFLNVDLDVSASAPLDWLVRYFARREVYCLSHALSDGTWLATFETNHSFASAEETTTALLGHIEAMKPPTRAKWDDCSKVFNVGYDVGTHPWALSHGFSPQTVSRVAQVGGGIRWTLYPTAAQPAATTPDHDQS